MINRIIQGAVFVISIVVVIYLTKKLLKGWNTIESLGVKTSGTIICSLITLALIFSGIFSLDYYAWHSYERDINRIIDNSTEEIILKYAETADYSSILNMSRYENDVSDLEPHEHGDPNYIDYQVIDYYWKHIGYREKVQLRGNSYMHYEAEIYSVSSIRISLYISEYGHQKILIESEPTLLSYGSYFEHIDKIAIINETDYSLYYHERGDRTVFELEKMFTKCYIVEMTLRYGTQSYGLCGRGFHFRQFSILNDNGEILSVFTSRGDWIS